MARRVLAVVALVVSALSGVVAQAPPATAGPGDLDPSFNGGRPIFDGAPPMRYEAVTTQRDGKIVAAGTGWRDDQMDVEVVRYTTTGALDAGFGTGGARAVGFRHARACLHGGPSARREDRCRRNADIGLEEPPNRPRAGGALQRGRHP